MAKVSTKRAVRRALTDEQRLIKSMTKVKDSFQNWPLNLGMGTDNALSHSSYGFNPITRQRTLLEWIHRGSWIGGMAIDIIADDMTREGIDLRTPLNPSDEEELDDTALRLDVWGKLNEGIKWGRLYGGAICVPLIDGQKVEDPLLLDRVGRNAFKGLVVLDRWMLDPSLNDLVTEIGPRIGEPKFYAVTADAPALRSRRIHYSRAWRFGGVELPYWQKYTENLWSVSEIERLYDRLVAFDSASTGAAQRVYKSFLRTLKIDGLRQAISMGGKALDGVTGQVAFMSKMQGLESVTVIDSKDDFQVQDSATMSGIGDVLLQFGQQLSGALQIPLVRLFGQSPSGLNSSGDSDLKTYYDGIKKLQSKRLSMPVRAVYYLMAKSAGIPLDQNFAFRFKPLWQMDQAGKANVAEVIGRTIGAAKEMGIISHQTALKELREQSHDTGIFTNITEEDVNAADDEPPKPEELGGGGEEDDEGEKLAAKELGGTTPAPSETSVN